MSSLSDAAEAAARQFAREFAVSQNFPRAEIVRRQWMLIEALCRHARTHIPFYRDTGRLDPIFRKDGRFDPAGWKDIPILTRSEARDHEAALTAERLPQAMTPLLRDSSSGSTGTALVHYVTALQGAAAKALIGRALLWNKCPQIERVVTIEGSSTPDDLSNVAPEPRIVGAAMELPHRLPPREQVRHIARHRPTHAIHYPSVVLSWVETGDLEALSSLKVIICVGEVLRPETRKRIEEALGATVVNCYSASELGPIAIEGPGGHLRLSEETMLVEDLTAADQPSAPSPLVATPFYGHATGLIRYAPGDFVRFGAPSQTDSPALRRLEAVLGRQRNLFVRRDGTRFFPAIWGDHFRAVADSREWQVVQETLDEIVLRIVIPHGRVEAEIEQLKRLVEGMVPGFAARVEIVDAITDGRAHGKGNEQCVSLIA
jgi:phenylacetate-CoA ligase